MKTSNQPMILASPDSIRLDHFLVAKLEHSRSLITKMIKDGEVLVNNQKVKPGYMLKPTDQIEVFEQKIKKLELEPVNLSLDIVYEDDHLLIVNKPKGLVVHPASSYSKPTLVHGLLYQMNSLSNINGVNRPGIIHRIDKDTSGLLMVAKTNQAHQILSKDLSLHLIKRSYYAFVHGQILEKRGKIDAPIGRDPKSRIKMGISSTGRHAITHFEVIDSFKKYTLIQCDLETGRTHQIRVHMAYINHPIVGDVTYGIKPPHYDGGQLLHAYKLVFTHPITKKAMEFEVPLPNYFVEFRDSLN